MGEIRVLPQLQVPSLKNSCQEEPPEPPLDSSPSLRCGKLAPFGAAGAFRADKLAELRFIMDVKPVSLQRGGGVMIGSIIRQLLPDLPFRYPPSAGCQEKYFSESGSVVKKGSSTGSRRWRRLSRQLHDDPLQLNIDFLVLATGSSLGITVGSTFSVGSLREIRDSNTVGRKTGRKMRRRTVNVRDKRKCATASSVGPYLIAYDVAGDAFSEHSHNNNNTMAMSYDGDRSEDRQSEEVQSAYKREDEFDEDVVTRAGFGARHNAEEQNDETDWSWVLKDKDGDPLAESISSLQTTQEVLENDVQKLSDLVKDSEAEESTCGDNEQDVIVLPHGRAGVFEMNEKMQHLEQKLKEASTTIRQKDLRISNLEVVIDSAQRPLLEEDAANIVELEMEVERQLQDRIQAEIQWLVMVKAKQNWQVRAEDQIALEEHKSSAAGDNTKMMLKLRDTESKIVMLKEQVDRLEVHEKELHRTTEALKMQSRTFKVSLCGLLQLIMLGFSLKMFFEQASAPFSDVVPT